MHEKEYWKMFFFHGIKTVKTLSTLIKASGYGSFIHTNTNSAFNTLKQQNPLNNYMANNLEDSKLLRQLKIQSLKVNL